MDEVTKKYIDISCHYRGSIIHECVMLEKHIDECLVIFFAKKNRETQFIEIILDRLNFDGKIQSLEFVVKEISGNDFKKKFSKLFSSMREVKDERNKFAHYMLSTHNVNNEPTTINLVNFRNSTKIEPYTFDKYERIRNKISISITSIVNIKSELG